MAIDVAKLASSPSAAASWASTTRKRLAILFNNASRNPGMRAIASSSRWPNDQQLQIREGGDRGVAQPAVQGRQLPEKVTGSERVDPLARLRDFDCAGEDEEEVPVGMPLPDEDVTPVHLDVLSQALHASELCLGAFSEIGRPTSDCRGRDFFATFAQRIAPFRIAPFFDPSTPTLFTSALKTRAKHSTYVATIFPSSAVMSKGMAHCSSRFHTRASVSGTSESENDEPLSLLDGSMVTPLDGNRTHRSVGAPPRGESIARRSGRRGRPGFLGVPFGFVGIG